MKANACIVVVFVYSTDLIGIHKRLFGKVRSLWRP